MTVPTVYVLCKDKNNIKSLLFFNENFSIFTTSEKSVYHMGVYACFCNKCSETSKTGFVGKRLCFLYKITVVLQAKKS